MSIWVLFGLGASLAHVGYGSIDPLRMYKERKQNTGKTERAEPRSRRRGEERAKKKARQGRERGKERRESENGTRRVFRGLVYYRCVSPVAVAVTLMKVKGKGKSKKIESWRLLTSQNL